jgi:type I restriction enzyme S subunit
MGSELRNLWVSAGGIAPDEWTFLALEDLLLNPKSISVGVMYPGKHTEGGAPLIKVGDVANGAVVKTPDFCISESVDEEYKRTRLKGQELLLTLVGNPGDCVIVLPEMAGWNVARALAVLTLKDENLRYWLRIILLSNPLKHIIDSRLNTTVQRTLNLKDVRQLPIPLPPKSIRDYLCNIARTLELKIQLNRETNKTLEQMAQALFKSWFVDFDPVIDNALAAGKPIPEELQARAQRRQQQLAKPDHQPLPDDVLQLFPSEFEETEALGWVPKGWEVKSVNEAVYINPRVSLAKGSIAKFADMKALPTNGYSITNIIDKEYSGGAKFQNGDVLLARITPCLENGKTGVVDFLNDDEVGFGSTEFIVMRRKGAISMPFVACLSRDANFRKHCMQSMVGSSGRQRVQNSCFDAYHLAIPQSDKLLMLFEQTASTFFSLMTGNKLSIGVLENLRDTLLPKLISGELRLPESLLDSEPNPLMDEVS